MHYDNPPQPLPEKGGAFIFVSRGGASVTGRCLRRARVLRFAQARGCCPADTAVALMRPGMVQQYSEAGRRSAMLTRVNFVHGVAAPSDVARIGGARGYAPTSTGTPPDSFAIEACSGQQPTNLAQIFSYFLCLCLTF